MDNNFQSDFNLISCEPLFARVEKRLQSYASNNLIDTDDFFPQIKWFIANLGLAMFERNEAVLSLKDYKSELPCDFHLLDSAWLCSNSSQPLQDAFQSSSQVYTTTTTETVCTGGGCKPTSFPYGVTISTCNAEHVLDKITITQYVSGANPNTFNFNRPQLLTLRPYKNVEQICTKDCKNLFYSSPNEVSIKKQGSSYYLYSTLKEPVIYVLYIRYPIEEKTGLPLIPDDGIIQKAIEDHLIYFSLLNLWTDGQVADIADRVKFWKNESEQSRAIAASYSVTPSFQKMVETTRRERKKWQSFMIPNVHW